MSQQIALGGLLRVYSLAAPWSWIGQENLRWIEGYERVAEHARELPQVRQIYVADREADFLAWLCKARGRQAGSNPRRQEA